MTSPVKFRHLRSRIEDGVLVLTLTASELRGAELTLAVGAELVAAFDQSGVGSLVVDMASVKFIASLGLTALLTLRRHLDAKKGQLMLCNLTPLVADVLYATRLADKQPSGTIPFILAPDVPTAVATLKGGRPGA